MPFLLAFWRPIAIGIAALALLGALAWAKHGYDERRREEGRSELRPQIAALQGSIEDTRRRATDLALLWSSQVDKTEAASRQSEVSRAETFAALSDRARRIAAPSRLSADAVQLSDDARRAASGQTPGPAAKPPEAAPAPASSTEIFIVQMYEWAAVCKARVSEWEQFYKSLQGAVNEVQ